MDIDTILDILEERIRRERKWWEEPQGFTPRFQDGTQNGLTKVLHFIEEIRETLANEEPDE